ncbi:transglutaminase domain-containing protein [Slackia heliotrinireducens]|uniref:transglutaminase domain-containing protein n=1 Tax=Slackia heliotrinireducens TaxID=84110 RepID=UPI003315030B
MLPEYVKFYHDKLPDWMRPIYERIYWSVRNQDEAVIVDDPERKLDIDQLLYLQECIYYDCPAFYYWRYAKATIFTFAKGNKHQIKLMYWYTPEKRADFDRRLSAVVQRFLNARIVSGMTQYERELAIHDYLVQTVTYDTEALAVNNDPTNPRHHDEIYSVLGALLKRKAVCAGISSGFKLLCDAARIKCFVVVGSSTHESDAGERHAWNMVKLDGETYHLDATWDIRDAGDIRMCYDYLNLTDGLIRFDHTWSSTIYPACTALEYNYYHRGRYFVTKLDRVGKYVRKHLAAGERYLAFKFANDAMAPDDAIAAEIKKGIRAARVSCTYDYYISQETHNIYLRIREI